MGHTFKHAGEGISNLFQGKPISDKEKDAFKTLGKTIALSAAGVIVGGGIDSPFKLLETIEAGADIVVVGNVFEKDPSLLTIMAKVVNNFNEKIN